MKKIRRQARHLVLQCLYELDFTQHSFETAYEHHFNEFGTEMSQLPKYAETFALKIGDGIVDNQQLLNDIINKFAHELPVEQMSYIDRNILRFAVYELLFFEEGTPVSVVINESIELAKTFGGDNSSRFIHGVLSELVKENVSPERLTPSFQSSALERKESSALERKESSALERKESSALERKEALRWNERSE